MAATNNSSKRIHDLLAPAVEAESMELVMVQVVGSGGRQVLKIMIDKPGGVTIDDCARISRSLSVILDVEDPISGRYTLEVGSPGVNRPLITPEHFERFVGQRIRVKGKRVLSGNARNLLGRLVKYEDDPPRIHLETEDETVEIVLDDIAQARIDFSFDKD